MGITMESLTLGQIAEKLGQPLHKIGYAIKSRRLECDGRAGRLRMYGPDKVRLIAQALENMKLRAELAK